MGVFLENHETIVLSLLKKRFRTDYAKAGDFSHQPEAHLYSNPSIFACDYLLYNYLRKSLLAPSSDISGRTFDNWLMAERQCFATNQRLRKVTGNSFLARVTELITSVIGLEPPSKLCDSGHWSTGATSKTKRGTHWSSKMNGTVAVTSSASSHVPFYFKGLGDYGLGEFAINRTNRAVQVPKTSKVNRMISCENAANSFMQHSAGRYIRDCLLKVGIDLRDQSANQEAAFRAAADSLATIDLSMASDTLAFSLVEHILPPAWFSFLNSLRSQFTEFGEGSEKRVFFLDKFSSMGNAFTFELETLIFWAICKSVTKDSTLLVYGDDIICSQRDAPMAIKALEYCGFIVNWEKSFTSGLFFESCGKHYHSLEDVTPVFQKEVIDVNNPLTVYRAHNRLFRWGQRNNPDLVKDACAYLISLLRKEHVLFIPVCERDDGILSVDHPFLKTDSGDYRCHVLRETVKYLRKVDDLLCLGYCLKTGVHAELPNGQFSNASVVSGFRKKSVVIWNSSLSDVSYKSFVRDPVW